MPEGVKFPVAVLAAMLSTCGGAALATYPEQPIKIVVPFTPGGATDSVARLLANRLTAKLGQPVIVENRPGASTVIGAEAVARAKPDGYTLMVSGSTTYTVLPSLKASLPYDPLNSYSHVGIVALAPLVLLAQNDLPVQDLQQFKDLARDKSAQGGMMYGTFGPGSAPHLAGVMFAEAAQASMTPVPYKGSAPMVTALVGGEIAMGVDTVSSAAPLARAGKVRALAVTGEHRVPRLPSVPTFREAGMPDVDLLGWYALVAPARTSEPVLQTLSTASSEIMADGQVRKSVGDLALEPVFMPVAEFRQR